MNNKKVTIIISIFLALALAIGGGVYGYNKYQENQTITYEAEAKEKLKNSLENNAAESVVSLINDFEIKFKDKPNLQNLEQPILDSFVEYCDGIDYSKFNFMDSVTTSLAESDNYEVKELNIKLKKILDGSQKNRFLALLQGYWLREDKSTMSGSVILIQTTNDSTIATLVFAVENPFTFAEGDLKWKELTIVGDKRFIFQDLNKSPNNSKYSDGAGTFDDESQIISIAMTGEGDATLGSIQTLRKITEDEFNAIKAETNASVKMSFSLDDAVSMLNTWLEENGYDNNFVMVGDENQYMNNHGQKFYILGLGRGTSWLCDMLVYEDGSIIESNN